MAGLRASVLDGPGSLAPDIRRKLAQRRSVAEPLDRFAEVVFDRAYDAQDEDVQALLSAGYTEDQVYEATLAIAVGAGLSRLEAGLAAVEASLAERPEAALPDTNAGAPDLPAAPDRPATADRPTAAASGRHRAPEPDAPDPGETVPPADGPGPGEQPFVPSDATGDAVPLQRREPGTHLPERSG